MIELTCEGTPEADPVWAIDPNIGTEILAEFASVEGAEKSEKRWMEKFGEWKSVVRVHDWSPDGKAVWEVNVLKPGEYCVHLTYAGEGRLVWSVNVEGGESHSEPAKLITQLSGVSDRLDSIRQTRSISGRGVVSGGKPPDGESQSNSICSHPLIAPASLNSPEFRDATFLVRILVNSTTSVGRGIRWDKPFAT